jgi:Tol biopolymer transport system component
MDSNGHHKKQLTSNPAYDSGAGFSPNGRRILFDSDRTGHDQVFIMRADGTHQRRITHDSLETDDPVFFPSGNKIAFTAYNTPSPSCKSAIFVMKLDATHRHRITDKTHCQFYPDVSPNGKLIAFSRDNAKGNPDLFEMRADGSHLHRLTKTSDGREFDATFSPDSKKLAYDRGINGSDYDIRVMTASGKHDHRAPRRTQRRLRLRLGPSAVEPPIRADLRGVRVRVGLLTLPTALGCGAPGAGRSSREPSAACRRRPFGSDPAASPAR